MGLQLRRSKPLSTHRSLRRSTAASLFFVLAMILVGCSPVAEIEAGHPLTRDVLVGIRSGQGTFDHSDFDGYLKKYVDDRGFFRYADAKKEGAVLQRYLARLADAKIGDLAKNEILALLMNAYNAYTIDLILRNYPVESIRKLDDPWGTEFCKVGGQTVSLDFLEKGLLLPKETFGDPRIHFGVNCASIGCPPLQREAFVGKNVDRQLEQATRSALARPDYLRVEGEEVYVTKILSWYKKDFVDEHGSLSKFLIPYASGRAKQLLEAQGDGAIEFLSYDWKLNEAKAPTKK